MNHIDHIYRRKRLGEAIRLERTRQGLSQDRLAKMSGTSQTWVSQVEQGERNIKFDSLCKIAEALDVELSDLVR